MRTLIFSGGRLDTWALSYIEESDFFIGVDRGALFLVKHQLPIHLAIGDFDSVTNQEKKLIEHQTKTYIDCDPIMKDETDTEMAFSYALAKETSEIVVFGAIGTRVDHSLANIQLLYKALEKGIKARIVDEYNEIYVVSHELIVEKDRFKHISLLPLTQFVTGITLSGFVYPLEKASITFGQTIGISNVLKADKGHIKVDSGLLLVIKSNDR